MKKNILLVQSLVTLAAFSTTQILSSENTPLIPKGFVERKDSQPLTKSSKKHPRKKGTQLGQLTQSAEIKKEAITIEQPKDEAIVVVQPTIEVAPAPVVIELTAAPKTDAILVEAPVVETVIIETAQPTTVLEKDIKEIMTPEEQKQAKMDREFAENRLTEDRPLKTLLIDITKEKTLKPVEITAKVPSNPLEQSTLGLKKQTRELGWLSNFAKSIKGTKNTLLGYLTSDTFEVDNQIHLDLLDDTIVGCMQSNDTASLMTIAQTIAEHYPSVRSSKSDVLFEYLSSMYLNQVKTSHTTLQLLDQKNATEFNNKAAALKEQIAQLSNAHKAMTADLTKLYEAEVKKEQKKLEDIKDFIVKTSVLLDKPNSLKKVTLFPSNPLVVPADSIANVQKSAETALSGLITRSNLPLIQAPVTNQ